MMTTTCTRRIARQLSYFIFMLQELNPSHRKTESSIIEIEIITASSMETNNEQQESPSTGTPRHGRSARVADARRVGACVQCQRRQRRIRYSTSQVAAAATTICQRMRLAAQRALRSLMIRMLPMTTSDESVGSVQIDRLQRNSRRYCRLTWRTTRRSLFAAWMKLKSYNRPIVQSYPAEIVSRHPKCRDKTNCPPEVPGSPAFPGGGAGCSRTALWACWSW